MPTQAAPISAAVQLNAPVTTRLPARPGWPIRLAADLVEVHPRGDHAAVADLVVHVGHGDARSRARDGDHGQRVVCARRGVGAAHHGVQLAPLLVPPGAVGRVVLLARDHPLPAVAAGDRLHPAGRVGRIEVGPAGHVGERVGREQVTLEILGERPQEPLLLLRRAVLDHRLQAQPGGQQRRRHVDIDPGEFLGGDGQVEHGEPGHRHAPR